MANEILYNIKAVDQASQTFKAVSSSILEGSISGKSLQNSMTGVGNSLTAVIPAAQNAQKGILDFIKASDGSSQVFKDITSAVTVLDGPLGGIASRFRAVGTLLKSLPPGAVAATLGFVALTAATLDGLKNFGELEEQTLKLQAVLQSTGRVAPDTAVGLSTFSKELSETTLNSREAVVGAEALAASFKHIPSEDLEHLVRTAADLSATMGGDLQANVRVLGRLLNDPANGFDSLRRKGLSFNDAAKETIKQLQATGQLADADADIFLKLSSIQGAGAAAAAGQTGAQHSLGEAFKEFTITLVQSTGVTDAFKILIEGLTFIFDKLARTIDYTTLGVANMIDLAREGAERLRSLTAPTEEARQAAVAYADQLAYVRDRTNELVHQGEHTGEAQATAWKEAAKGTQVLTEAQREYYKQQDDFNRDMANKGPGYTKEQLAASKSILSEYETEYEKFKGRIASINAQSDAAVLEGAKGNPALAGLSAEAIKRQEVNDETAKYNKLLEASGKQSLKNQETEAQRLGNEIGALQLLSQNRNLDLHQAEAEYDLAHNKMTPQRAAEIAQEETLYAQKKALEELNKDNTELYNLQLKGEAIQSVINGQEKSLDLAELQQKIDNALTPDIKQRLTQIKAQTEANDNLNQTLKIEEDLQNGIESATEDAFSSIIKGSDTARAALLKLINSFEDLATKAAFTEFNNSINSGGGFLSGLFGTGAKAAGAASSSTGLLADIGSFFADGGVFDEGRVKKFAGGGSFSNKIVNSPTHFNIGQMGEAGPEAILPLGRLSDGSLGIKGSGGGGNNITAPMTIQVIVQGSNTDNLTDPAQAQKLSNVVANTVNTQFYKLLDKESKTGGRLAGAKR